MQNLTETEYNANRLWKNLNTTISLLVKSTLSGISLDEKTINTIRELENKATVIYTIKHQSHLDCLTIREAVKNTNLPEPIYAHGINMFFSYTIKDALNLCFVWFKRLFFMVPSPSAKKNSFLKRLIKEGKSAIIHLGSEEHFKDIGVNNAISQLMESVQEGSEVVIVPMLVTYGRRREKEDENIIQIVFGQTEYTGSIRHLITFIRYARRAIVVAGTPIYLSQYINENSMPMETFCTTLRGELIASVDAEKTAIIGPALKSRNEIIDTILSNNELTNEMNVIAQREGKNYNKIFVRAKKQLQEIAADYDEIYISIMDVFLGWLWNNIYDGIVVDKQGLAKVKEISRKMPFVVIPCHRSHIDYLLLSYVFYKNNLPMPFVAA
ncbi:MAG: 1-acyl-sn-glycerol-3-phosphate acyltransferase, partial [Deltaproteobacteria bacterium]